MKIINSKLALHKSGYMKTKTIIYTFLLLLVLTVQRCQCKKDDPIPTPTPVDYRPNTIFGKVVDKTTGQGIAHARVYFLTGTRVILGNPSWHTTSTQYSDSSGNFSFTTTPRSDSIYEVYSIKDLYFDDGNNATEISYTDVGYAKSVMLQPMAWMKLHVKNVNPFNDADEIHINGVIGGTFTGKSVDTSIIYPPVFGNQTNLISIFITKNGNQTNKQENIFCTSFDTTLFKMFY